MVTPRSLSSSGSSVSPSSFIRHDWQQEEVVALLSSPLLALLDKARSVHRAHHVRDDVQLANLLSIKSGGCPEDCAYCPQSARYRTHVKADKLMDVQAVKAAAKKARQRGATRFCMGSAWRSVKDGKDFDAVLAMVRAVRALGMEACVTLGMLTQKQAQRLAQAGLTAYNHNLDSGPSFYERIITTRRYEDRLRTLAHVRASGVQLCCGGIIGMGESLQDRAELLVVLSSLQPHPESVPINALVAVEGTPLEDQPPIDPFDMVRMCAATRIVMPQTRVRLSAGRAALSSEAQALCFYAGANSIFFGDKLLTTDNNDCDDDKALMDNLGLQAPEPTERTLQRATN
ncbi:MAG: biotin synthase BioB [Alphaproteobacteria bacterium GM202ARS2]|nr:biotin synthase BioB [Alphaproteobacteria bacterium GM202ARS2]